VTAKTFEPQRALPGRGYLSSVAKANLCTSRLR
jgi:hypothetical protein